MYDYENFQNTENVCIPVRIQDGKLLFCYDNQEVIIAEDVEFSINIRKSYLHSRSILDYLKQKEKNIFFKKGEVLLAKLFPTCLGQINDKDKKYLYDVVKDCKDLVSPSYVEIELLEDLFLQFKGSEKPKLTSCKCKIPYLSKEVISLNHAYTTISTEFEKSRKSHTGNVFDKILYKNEHKRWHTIRSLRDHFQWEFERKYFNSPDNI
jgi:hypothetical protein